MQCCWEHLWRCIHHIILYYTSHYLCIRDILFHAHAYRIVWGDNSFGVQQRRRGGTAGDTSGHGSRRRGAESQRVPWVPRWPTHLFPQRQAPEHPKSPMFYEILLGSFMFDALGYKSWLKTLNAWNYLVQIHIPLTLCRFRIEYMLSHA